MVKIANFEKDVFKICFQNIFISTLMTFSVLFEAFVAVCEIETEGIIIAVKDDGDLLKKTTQQ